VKFLKVVYTFYASIIFIATFFLVLPVYLFADWFDKPKLGLIVNHYWAKVYFFLIGMPIEIEMQFDFDKKQNYILCANHFSFLDVAIMPFAPIPFKYVGKISISKVPFFGYMFKRFHITVDRDKSRSRYETYKKSISALVGGFSLAIFPEGGIRSTEPPKMASFKEGAFRMSVETGVPLVPVSFADSWHIFPSGGKVIINRRKCRIIFHKPIDPLNYSVDTLKKFKDDVFNIIQNGLDKKS
jgi:1-acyl-sn-glycerol-3-phosphate acyltransferase